MTPPELDSLLVDRATVGLAPEEAERLAALLAEHPDVDVEAYERLAAELDLALWGREERLPEGLGARLDAAAEAFIAELDAQA